ncbi:hypothetical protein VTO42DRAFT_5000 [Malbranchea cinnamomea]
MVSKKGSRSVSKISSAAAPAEAAATTLSAHKSSILRSAFSPSEYQLALFASVIQGLDAHHLRIHDVNSGRLQCDHAVNPRESITCLDWGYYGDSSSSRTQHQKKKRKRNSGVNGAVPADDSDGRGDVVVAFGTSTSEIRMYSPAEDKITGTLSGGHERGIRDFKFTAQKPGVEGWSIGGDGKLIQWDLRKGRSMRVISLPSTSVSTLARPVPSNPPVLCASQTPYIIDLEKGSENEVSFSAMRNTVHTLISSSTDLGNLSEEFLAADSDRYLNVFDTQKKKLLGSFVAGNDVDSVSLYTGTPTSGRKEETSRLALFQRQVLAVVTRDGTIELFSGPFHQFRDSQLSNAASNLKSLRKSMTRRADAVIRIIRPDNSRTAVPVVSVSFHGPDLVVAWVEGGVSLAFDRIRWQNKDSEDLALQGEVEIVKARSNPLAGSTLMNGVKDVGKSHVDETHAVVEQGGMAESLSAMDVDAISVPSDDEDNEEADSQPENDDEQEEDDDDDESSKSNRQLAKTDNEDIDMADAEDNAEPSFGELLRAHNSEPIDVAALDEEGEGEGAVVSASSKSQTVTALPSGLSLSTVLTQSLKTNDNTLLESCFHTTDLTIVRATIQRLDSSLAATLLTKLAERISTRPGRYGHLLVWVQWTCVAHGGAIAGRPEILKEMSALFKVMDQRSKSLGSLLLLKGKLDMLDAQLGLRQSMRRGGSGGSGGGAGDSEDEEGVIYVEGQEDLEDEEEEENEPAGESEHETAGETPAKNTKKAPRGLAAFEGDEEEDDEDMPLTVNGVASDDEENESSEEEEDDDDDDDEDLVDDEAELSVASDEEVSEDEDEDDEEEEEDGSMRDFIADSDEESEISVPAAAPVSKKGSNKVKKAGKR